MADPNVGDALTVDELFERVSKKRFRPPERKDFEEALKIITQPLYCSVSKDDQGKCYSTGGKRAMIGFQRALERCIEYNNR